MTLDLPLMEEPATVELTDVVRTYSGATGGVRALDGVSARFESGLFTVVAGPSGSGKSTLLRVAALLDKPQEGLVGFNGRDVTRASARRRRALRRRHIGYMFQQPADNLLDYLDAREHVRLGGRLRSDDEDAAALGTLDFLGLAERITHRPVQLSGGEQQRLAFAFAVAGGPQLLVADEPVAPGVRHGDLQPVGARLHRPGDVDRIGRRPTHPERPAVHASFTGRDGDGARYRWGKLLQCERAGHFRQ